VEVRINPRHFSRDHVLATVRRLQKEHENEERVTISRKLLAALIFFAEQESDTLPQCPAR